MIIFSSARTTSERLRFNVTHSLRGGDDSTFLQILNHDDEKLDKEEGDEAMK